MENRFIRAEEVADELGVSKPYAYKLIRQLNEELKDKGFITSQGGSTASISTNGSTGPERKGTKCQSLRTKQEEHGRNVHKPMLYYN